MILKIHPVPPIPRDLLDYLQAIFPNKLPEQPPGPGVVEMLIGQQKVLAHLKVQYDLQNRDMLGNK